MSYPSVDTIPECECTRVYCEHYWAWKNAKRAAAIVATHTARQDPIFAALRRHADTVYAHYHVIETTHGLHNQFDDFDCGPFRTLEAARRAMAQLVADSEDAGNPYEACEVDCFTYGPHELKLVECTESFQECWLANDPRPFGGHYRF